MLVHEALGYNRFGLRYVSAGEMRARREFILKQTFPPQPPQHKPLSAFADKGKSLPEMVTDRHDFEMKQLEEEYHVFFKWPQSPEFQQYLNLKQKKEEDYKRQQEWVDLYQSGKRDIYVSLLKTPSLIAASLMWVAGAMTATQGNPATVLFWGAGLAMATQYRNYKKLAATAQEAAQTARIVLEDWYEPDPFARYDRRKLNIALKQLARTKPSAVRQQKKRELVAEFRSNHPRVSAEKIRE